MKRKTVFLALGLVLLMTSASVAASSSFSTEQLLGGALYFDKDLSINRNQSCASCHLPSAGFDDPDSKLPVSQGSILTEFGGRNAPSAAYAAFAPGFAFNEVDGLYIGGQFWDGRVNNLAEQAAGPPTNPVEMALADKKAVVARMAQNPAYLLTFKYLYGINLKNPASVEAAYSKMANAIGEFERTRQFNKFNSKYDYYLVYGKGLNAQELRGLALFEGKAQCVLCHPNTLADDGTPPIFTDFSFDNLGIPVNPEIAALHKVPVMPKDYGLGENPVVLAEARGPMIVTEDGRTVAMDEMGKFKVMSLRNIAVTGPWGHNGLFKSLKDIVHFYNTRDVAGAGWPAPEVAENVNVDELGDLKLTAKEEKDLVAFLMTLTDGTGPSPYGNVPVPPMP